MTEDFSLKLGGNFYDASNLFQFAKLKLNACKPSDTVVCAEGQDLDRFRRTGKLKLIYKDLQADLNNIGLIKNDPF